MPWVVPGVPQRRLSRIFAAACLAMSCAVAAQDNTVSVDELSPGQVYISETFRDWQRLCVKSGEETDSCHINQRINDATGHPTANISIHRYSGEEGISGTAVILTPLETLLTSGLELTIQNEAPVEYPFAWCDKLGCYARIALTDDDVFSMKQGRTGTIRIESIAAPGQPIVLNLSLWGFTKAFSSIRTISE